MPGPPNRRTVEGADRWAVDPEALILFTIGIGRRDPRLFDEMLDWVASNRELLSKQRLRNLARRFPLPSALVAAVIAWTRQTAPASLIVSDQGHVRGHRRRTRGRGPMTGSRIYQMIKRGAGETGYDPREIWLHQWRDTFANDWLAGGSEGELKK